MSQLNGLSDGREEVNGNGLRLNYIEHHVSKLDTLAGVAIKYGVEVADIKRLNGLVTDLQMFALRTLRIPLPGRHPPSSALCNRNSNSVDNGSKKMPPRLCETNMLESFESLRRKTPQSNVSRAMNTLQKYYGLGSSNIWTKDEGTEMTIYRDGSSNRSEGEWLPEASSISDLCPISYHKSRNLANGFLHQNVESENVPVREAGDGEADNDKSVRRRQKADVDGGVITPERLFKEENSGSSFSSSSTGKGLAMRPKSASRALLHAESDSVWLDSIPVGLGDSIMTDPSNSVRKSSSASSLKEQEKNNVATGWTPTKWSLKTDLQALSTSAITKPIFDGLPLPISGRKSKAALD